MHVPQGSMGLFPDIRAKILKFHRWAPAGQIWVLPGDLHLVPPTNFFLSIKSIDVNKMAKNDFDLFLRAKWVFYLKRIFLFICGVNLSKFLSKNKKTKGVPYGFLPFLVLFEIPPTMSIKKLTLKKEVWKLRFKMSRGERY